MKIRIGKELRISWSILTQGQNQPLEGRDLRLYLQEPNRQRRTLDFTTDANTLLVTIPANTLTRLGNYALILTENEGQDAQTAVDANPAFTLVETTEEEDTTTTEDPNLEVAHINLATGNLTLPAIEQASEMATNIIGQPLMDFLIANQDEHTGGTAYALIRENTRKYMAAAVQQNRRATEAMRQNLLRILEREADDLPQYKESSTYRAAHANNYENKQEDPTFFFA